MWSEHFQDVDTDALKSAVIPPQEEFMKGWLVVFINEYRQEQERVLLLSKDALYRVKFNFSNQKILRFQRTSINDITLIERGIIGDLDSKYYGFKLYYKDKSHLFGNTNAVEQAFFTFRPVVDEAHYSSVDAQKTVVENIVTNILKAKKLTLQNHSDRQPELLSSVSQNSDPMQDGFTDALEDNFIIEVDNLKVAGALPVISLAHNALGLGMQRPKKKPAPTQKPNNLPQSDQQVATEPIRVDTEPSTRPETDTPPSTSFEAPEVSSILTLENSNTLPEGSVEGGIQQENNNNENIQVLATDLEAPTESIQQTPVVAEEVKPVNFVELMLVFLNKVNSRNVAQLLDQIDSESHYIYGVVVAFFLGYQNFSILWIIAVLYVIHTYTSTKWSKLHTKQKIHNFHHVNVILNNSNGTVTTKLHKRNSSSATDLPSIEKLATSNPSSTAVDPLSTVSVSTTTVHPSTTAVPATADPTRAPGSDFHSNKTLPPISLLGGASNTTYPFNVVSMIETSIETENCEWFNTMMSQLWKYMVKHLSESAKEASISLLQNTLFNKNTPDSEGSQSFSLRALEISEFYLGDSSPSFKNMIASKPEFPDFRMECDMHFNAGHNGKVLADLVVTRGSAVTIKVPLSIDSLIIEGRMRFEFVFFSRYPYIHSVRYTFLEPPQMNLAIKPLCTFNVMALPFLKDYLTSYLQQLLETNIVYPDQLSLLYFQLFSIPTEPSFDDTAFMTPEDMSKHIPLVEKAKLEGDFAGLLHVKVVEAKKLNNEVMGANSCPYCILSFGSQVLTTRAYKVARSKAPVWNEFFELLITKNSHKQKVEITVMARDIMAGDDFVGKAALDFAHAGTEPKDVWLPMKRFMDKKEKQVAGEIRLQYRFIPNLATTAATISSSAPVTASNTSVLANLGTVSAIEAPLSI